MQVKDVSMIAYLHAQMKDIFDILLRTPFYCRPPPTVNVHTTASIEFLSVMVRVSKGTICLTSVYSEIVRLPIMLQTCYRFEKKPLPLPLGAASRDQLKIDKFQCI